MMKGKGTKSKISNKQSIVANKKTKQRTMNFGRQLKRQMQEEPWKMKEQETRTDVEKEMANTYIADIK